MKLLTVYTLNSRLLTLEAHHHKMYDFCRPLNYLNPIHNQGLRLALGAFRTSPVASLYVEADEPSLYSRREKLSLQYAIRLAANPSNPAHEVSFPPNYVNLYEQKPKAIKSFGIRISLLLESANIKPQNIEKNILHQIFQLGV